MTPRARARGTPRAGGKNAARPRPPVLRRPAHRDRQPHVRDGGRHLLGGQHLHRGVRGLRSEGQKGLRKTGSPEQRTGGDSSQGETEPASAPFPGFSLSGDWRLARRGVVTGSRIRQIVKPAGGIAKHDRRELPLLAPAPCRIPGSLCLEALRQGLPLK